MRRTSCFIAAAQLRPSAQPADVHSGKGRAVPKRRPSILFLLPHVKLFHRTGKISVDLRWIRMYCFVMQSLDREAPNA